MKPFLARLDQAASKLAVIDVPAVRGRAHALGMAGLEMRMLGREAEHGARLLELGGIDPESVRAVREASRLLGSKPLFERSVHDAAHELTSAVADVRARNSDLLATVDARVRDAIGPAKRVLDSVDSVMTTEQRAALVAALPIDPAFGSRGSVRVLDALVADLPTSTRAAVLRDMVGRPAGELGADELRLLDRLVQGRRSGLTGGILSFDSDPPYSSRLEEAIAGAIGGTNPRRVTELDRFFARDVVKRMPAHERLDMATTLFSKDVSELSPREWNLLEQLATPEVVGFDSGIVTYLEGHEALGRHIAFRTMQGLPPSESMYAYFDANALRGIANEARVKLMQARFESALDEAAGGSLSKASQTLLTASWPAVADRVSRMPIERQSAIAMTLLGLPSGPSGTLESVRAALHAIDQDLATMRVPTRFEDLYAHTKVLLERNIGRMEGRHDPTAVRGYSIHPDYAEVGQIRANGVLLRAVRDMAERDAAAARSAAASTGATTAVEHLAW